MADRAVLGVGALGGAIAILAAALLALGGCATSKPAKLPICDGNAKHRRPANPYGTVLPGAATPAPTPISGSREPAALPPPPTLPPSPSLSVDGGPSAAAATPAYPSC